LAGCTGFIGVPLVQALVEDGHECTVLIRTSASPGIDMLPKTVRLAPYAEMPHLADAVINFAGETVVGRWTKSKKARVVDTRVDLTRYLVRWMEGLTVKPSVFLSASAVGFYGDRGDELITEATGPDPQKRFRSQVCITWEQEANAVSKQGIRVVNLRTGNVLDPSGGMLGQMLKMFRSAPVIVPYARKCYLPWISLRDEIDIVRYALTHESVSGPVNLVAPTPATNAELFDGIGAILKKKVVSQIPPTVIRLVMGEFAQAVLESQRIIPEKIVNDGYAFHDTVLSEYLQSVKQS